jgi:hypothetical protein
MDGNKMDHKRLPSMKMDIFKTFLLNGEEAGDDFEEKDSVEIILEVGR